MSPHGRLGGVGVVGVVIDVDDNKFVEGDAIATIDVCTNHMINGR